MGAVIFCTCPELSTGARMSKLFRYFFLEEQPTFDGPDITGLIEALAEDAASLLAAPFRLTRGVPKLAQIPPPPRQKPPEPTVAELQQQFQTSLREVDLLPVSDEEKQEIRSQLELAFLRKVARTWTG